MKTLARGAKTIVRIVAITILVLVTVVVALSGILIAAF